MRSISTFCIIDPNKRSLISYNIHYRYTDWRKRSSKRLLQAWKCLCVVCLEVTDSKQTYCLFMSNKLYMYYKYLHVYPSLRQILLVITTVFAYWKCNFPMIPHACWSAHGSVHWSVCWSVGRSVIIFAKGIQWLVLGTLVSALTSVN